MSKIILWWGRSDLNYSRNILIRKLILELGYQIVYFHPKISFLSRIEAFFRINFIPSLVWVPCFRHRDFNNAYIWAKQKKVPIIFDPLISSWDKKINERNLYPIKSKKSENLKKWEADLFKKADFVIADTEAHLNFFSNIFKIPKNKFRVINVGVEENLFKPKKKKIKKIKEVLFYGSFLELHGIDVIINAAKQCKNRNIKWTLLGNYQRIKFPNKIDNIFFEDAIAYIDLPERINKADILLGIFGDSKKASCVIPNKVFQSISCGKPVITRISNAYPDKIIEENFGIFFITPNNSKELAQLVCKLCANEKLIAQAGYRSRQIYDKYFSEKIIIKQLSDLLKVIN